MSRGLTSGMLTATSAESSELIHFFELQFSGGTLLLVTSPHDVTWNSKTWTGIGGAMGFEPVQENTDVSGAGVNVVLSGVDQTVINSLLANSYIGRTVEITRAHIDSSGAIVADPILIFKGRMNGGFTIAETSGGHSAPGTVTVTGRMVSELALLDRKNGMQTNLVSHQRFFANNKFFEFPASIINKSIVWKEPK